MRRSSQQVFNPEKFLAADAKKKAKVEVTAKVFLGPSLLVLAFDYKERLFTQFEKDYPDILSDISDPGKHAIYVESVIGFLRRSLAKEKLKISDSVFGMLLRDFISGFEKRHGWEKLGEVP
jgi:hypothetical protein